MVIDEYAFRAESCRRVAKTLRDPEVVAALHELARHYDELAERLREGAKEPKPPGSQDPPPDDERRD
jgi:hypothetical protein